MTRAAAADNELDLFATRIAAADTPEKLFGSLDHVPVSDRLDYVKRLYRHFARIAHEDRHVADADKAIAKRAFQRLGELYAAAQQRLNDGLYGTVAERVIATIGTKTDTYEVIASLAAGDLSSVYLARDSKKTLVVLKVGRSTADTPFLANETKMIAKLAGPESRAWLPFVREAGLMKFDKGPPRHMLVSSSYSADWLSLADLATRFPDGVDPRHVVWIFKRVLGALGWVHHKGIVHGGILPSHVLVHPKTHGITLIGWGGAVDMGKPLRLMSGAYSSYYPPEVRAKQAADASTDIYMAATCLQELLPKDSPPFFYRIIGTCRWPSQARRHRDAWALHDAFVEVVDKVYPRTFIPLDV